MAQQAFMSPISLLPETATWQSRKVRYFAGDWDAIQAVIPDFELVPFSAGNDEPVNPFLQTVMRKPLTAAERPIPVGVVSYNYTLASHRVVAEICRNGVLNAGMDVADLRYEVGLSELGEWMNFRIYFPDSFCFIDARGEKLDLRIECFNSVNGSSRLVILFGWYRIICTNGLIIGETKVEIKERHGQGLDLTEVFVRFRRSLEAVQADRSKMCRWQDEEVSITEIANWANRYIAPKWGKKAAARVFHICDVGMNIRFEDPFEGGLATEKAVRYLDRVPGAPPRASSKYDVAQALSYVATRRKNAEERLLWQGNIADFMQSLPATLVA